MFNNRKGFLIRLLTPLCRADGLIWCFKNSVITCLYYRAHLVLRSKMFLVRESSSTTLSHSLWKAHQAEHLWSGMTWPVTLPMTLITHSPNSDMISPLSWTPTRPHLFRIKRHCDRNRSSKGKMRASSMSLTGFLSLKGDEDESPVCMSGYGYIFLCASALSWQPHLVTVSA